MNSIFNAIPLAPSSSETLPLTDPHERPPHRSSAPIEQRPSTSPTTPTDSATFHALLSSIDCMREKSIQKVIDGAHGHHPQTINTIHHTQAQNDRTAQASAELDIHPLGLDHKSLDHKKNSSLMALPHLPSQLPQSALSRSDQVILEGFKALIQSRDDYLKTLNRQLHRARQLQAQTLNAKR